LTSGSSRRVATIEPAPFSTEFIEADDVMG
jgi:hypothetical protein